MDTDADRVVCTPSCRRARCSHTCAAEHESSFVRRFVPLLVVLLAALVVLVLAISLIP
jgi:hypothetical protein